MLFASSSFAVADKHEAKFITKKEFIERNLKQLEQRFDQIDTNKDGKINQNDIRSLYLSSASGENFTKLSENLLELIDWNIIEAQNRLYFRCIEDINKNGAFDKNDKVHYHYVNLLADEWKVEMYSPN